MLFRRLTPDNQLRLHLAKSHEFWRADRLDLAYSAMQKALRVGLPVGHLYDFQRTVEAEQGARATSRLYRIAEHLIVEADSLFWGRHWGRIVQTTQEAHVEVTEALAVRWGKPILVTLFPSDEWVEFLHTRYGYYSVRTETHKICLPPVAVRQPEVFRRAVRHEMAHAAVHQLAREAAPRWLDEGVAVLIEGGSSLRERRSLQSAARQGHRMTLDDISGGFESYDVDLGSPRSLLCYAGAGDFVARLSTAYGFDHLRALLTHIGGGQRLDRAFRDVYGLPLHRVEKDWLRELMSNEQ